MRTIDQIEVASGWVKLGVLINVDSSDKTPDVEMLILDTVRVVAQNSRLFVAAASWLAMFGDYVAKRRLALLVRDELELEFRPPLGLLLEWAQRHSHRNRRRYREALAYCRPAAEAGPLFEVSRRNHVLRKLAKSRASDLSKRWGCWMEGFEIRHEILRSADWIGRENPSLWIRAISGGDLVATITADANAGRGEFGSESELARRYGASRAAVRDALLKLKLAGCARQTWVGREHAILVAPQVSAAQKTVLQKGTGPGSLRPPRPGLME